MVHEESVDNRRTTVISNVTNSSLLPFKAEEQEHVVHVVRATTLKLNSEAPFLVNWSASENLQIDSYTLFRQQYPCMAASGIMEFLLGRPFCIPVAIVKSFVTNLTKHKWDEITCQPPFEIVCNKNDEPSVYAVPDLFPDPVNVVHYKAESGRLQRMHQPETAQKNDDNCLNSGWRE